MTEANSGPSRLPFLLTFGEDVPQTPTVPYRYDRARQIGQVLASGRWVDAHLAPASADAPTTRKTRVARETTDDA